MGINNGVLDIVSISDFNKGKANKIFKDVRKKGAKLVVKHNKVECALVSPEVYEELMGMLEDLRLSAIANERLNRLKAGKTKIVSSEQMMKHLGIKKEDIDKMEIDLDEELEP